MLQIFIDGDEFFDEKKNEFISVKSRYITLEHSLLSISKWEAKWKKVFLDNTLDKNKKTEEEMMDYVRCMTITPNVDPLLYRCLSEKNISEINQYIEDPMTATTFSDRGNAQGRHQIISSELIYYWMVAYNIPSDYEKWHINRLLTLIRICTIKSNTQNNKMNESAIRRQNAALNAARRAKYKTSG